MSFLSGIWKEFLEIVRKEEGSRVVDTWFKAVALDRWDAINKIVYLAPPNNFVKEWICSNYISLIQLHLGRLFNVIDLEVKFDSEAQLSPNLNAPVPILRNKKSVKFDQTKGGINQNYNFETFVIGPNNSLAHAAALAVTEKIGQLYNPLFIYGRSGLGKTHLLHAIGNKIRQQSKAQVLYQSADRFVNEFIGAIRFNKTHLFKEKYKDIDLLLIDDIQFFSRKDQTQEAFFHIFNNLYESNKQIVFSSDAYPRDIEGLADRLKSRLESGLVVDIQKPTLETKIAILKKKATLGSEQVSDDIFYYIASIVDSNIRELEGALIRVTAFANLTGQELTLELAQKVLSGIKQPKQKKFSLDSIAKTICNNYSLNIGDLKSKSRNKKFVIARQIAMFFMKDLTESSLQEVGAFFNKKDHSTVSHAIAKVKTLCRVDDNFNSRIKIINKQLTS